MGVPLRHPCRSTLAWLWLALASSVASCGRGVEAVGAGRVELAHAFVPRLPEGPDGAWELTTQSGAPVRAMALEGQRVVAPHVNRFTKESLAFSAARAPTSWTFPSHAAMFSGLYPYQSGASARDRSLPAEAWTIAEHLSQAGYRTVAITEGGYVSPNFGLAQGFEWFESGPRDRADARACAGATRRRRRSPALPLRADVPRA